MRLLACLIVAPQRGYDEPAILSYAISSFCPTSADGLQATPLQHDQAPRLNRIQATSTRGVRARIRRVAGCATPTGSAGHAGATANLKLTFHLDHSAGAGQRHFEPADAVALFAGRHARVRYGTGELALGQGCQHGVGTAFLTRRAARPGLEDLAVMVYDGNKGASAGAYEAQCIKRLCRRHHVVIVATAVQAGSGDVGIDPDQ